MRLSELLALCRRELDAHGLPSAPDAEIIVSHLTGVPRSRFLLEAGRDAGDLSRALGEMVRRRASGEPLQYVLGSWEFYGREFLLSRDTLIPRPETEGLVECAMAALRGAGRDAALVLDVGTGCGAIAVTLAAELPRARVVAVDVSPGALAVAAGNARRARVADRVLFVCADAYSALKTGVRFDVVVSNPPYVSEGEWDALPPEVRDFEPPVALRAGADGLSVIRRLVSGAAGHLSPGGVLLCEIGETQGDAVGRLPAGRLSFDGVVKDLAGRDRVARWTKRE